MAGLALRLGVDELFSEAFVVGLLGRLLDFNLFPVVADFVDDPLDRLAQLKLVESLYALGLDGDTAPLSVTAPSGCFFKGAAAVTEFARPKVCR